MRVERVFTHHQCNQACTFCTFRRATDVPGFARGEAVRARIAAAIGQGVSDIVLTGGEPGMRADLVELVRFAKESGATSVVLETNATLIELPRAVALHAAGLSRARVHVLGDGPDADAISQDPGGSARTWSGLRALLAAGVPVTLAAVLVRSTRELLLKLPQAVVDAVGLAGLHGLELTVPTALPASDATNSAGLLDPEALAVSLQAIDDAARRVGLPVHLAPGSGPPPCVFGHQGRVAHLYALSPGDADRPGFRRVDACARCLVADRCPGWPEALATAAEAMPLHPVTAERIRRRLTVIDSLESQVARDLVVPNFLNVNNLSRKERDAGLHTEHLVRVIFHCNQSCRFCFVYTHLPPPEQEQVRDAIRRAAAADARITLTGGEPTLNPQLPELVALARSLSRHAVGIQSNAIRLADPALTDALVQAGLGHVTVSLHASHAELSDAITGAPGTFVQTVAGLDQLHRTDLPVNLNFVITRRNIDDLLDYVRLVAARWPRFALAISLVAPSSEVVPRDAEMVPRYGEVLDRLAVAWREAERLRLDISGLESMCGMPLCLAPVDLQAFFAMHDVPADADAGEFVKPPVCATCALAPKCYGMRRGYLEMYGDGELKPVFGLATNPQRQPRKA